MLVPLSWLRVYADLPAVGAAEVAADLVRVGLKVERITTVGGDLAGPVVVGEVRDIEEFTASNGKSIRWCQVDVGDTVRGIICGAANFAEGDRVVVALPGSVLAGGFSIGARRSYGHVSDGMICSARELGVGDEHAGILVVDPSSPVGADAVSALGLRDDVLDIEVTPDRGYALSIRGIAREAAAAFGVAYRDPAAVRQPSTDAPAVDGPAYDVRVADSVGCDRYVARVVTGLDPAATTPFELRRRLLLAGMRPISLPVDVTNLVLLELGQPLHAFDRDRLTGPIVVRRAGAGERLVTLDGVTRTLTGDDLVIADGSGPVALAGVMGGGPTEVSAATTDLVIEAAHFAPLVVAATARRHKLSTEASRRYERGVDDDLPVVGAEAAVRMLVELGGAKPAPGRTDVDARPPIPTISLRWDLPARLAGRPYGRDRVRHRLTQVGCALAAGDNGAAAVGVIPPSWRPDLRIAEDLVEEVLRLEGYDLLPSVLPAAPAGRGLTQEQRLRRQVSRAVAAAGYVETPTYPFVSAEVWDSFGLAEDDPRRSMLALANPLVDDEPFLRTSLLPGLLAALARNVGRGTADVGLFETGSVFLPRPGGGPAVRPPGGRRPDDEVLAQLDATLPDQPVRLAVVAAGLRTPRGWWGPGRPAGWADAVQAARTAATAVHVELTVGATRRAPWHPGRCARLSVTGSAGDVVIGYAGELHPGAVERLGLPPRTVATELDLGRLLAAAPEAVPAPAASPFPPATLDVALVVPSGVPAAQVGAALREGGGELLEALTLFDVYTGPQIPAGTTSLAFTLRLRAGNRTLTGEEAATVRDAALAAAARRTGAALRGGRPAAR